MTRARFGLATAAFVAAVDLLALCFELWTAVAHGAAIHRRLAETLFLHLRYFTILTNWMIVVLLLVSVARGVRGRPLPAASWYGAALVFILVVCATYEALLRRTGAAHDVFFVSDMILHDITPAFYAAFWLGFAPKRGLGPRDPLLWLAFPAAYFAVTLVAGSLGEGYPYFFLSVTRIGWTGVLTSAAGFLLAFFLLGLFVVLVSRVVPRGIESSRPLVEDFSRG